MIKKYVTLLFSYCERHDKLEMAIRRFYRCPQWFMAQRLMTSQCYISHWETGKLVKEGEEERLYYNLEIDLKEVLDNMGEVQGYLAFLSILTTYLGLTARLRLDDWDKINLQIMEISQIIADKTKLALGLSENVKKKLS